MYARNGKDTVLVDDRRKNRLCRVPAMQSGGGGLVGTIDDYARFCQALTAGGDTRRRADPRSARPSS